LKVTARAALDGSAFQLLGTPEPGFDPDLKAILEEQKKPVSHYFEHLGTFTLNRSVGWFQADVDWRGQGVQLVFDQEEDMSLCAKTALTLMENAQDWDDRIRDYAIRALPEQREQLEVEELADLSPEELSRRLECESIQVWGDGRFEFWFHDADYVWTNTVCIGGNLNDGLTKLHL
jgi:hypothetical protein